MGKRDERDKEKVKLICQDCGIEYKLSYGRYRRLNKEDGHRCKECRYINNAKSASNKYQSLSPEDKKALNAKRAQYWKDPNNRKKKSEDMSNMISNMSQEEKDKWISGMREYNESLPPELQVIHLINYYKNLSQEEKDELNKRRYDPLKKWKDNMNDIELSDFYSNIAKSIWDSYSDEERKERGNKISEGRLNNFDWNNLPVDEKMDWVHLMISSKINSKLNKTKSEFMNHLNINNIKYEFQYLSKTKHPDFDKLFPNNPVTGGSFVFPFHSWDFKLNLSDKSILVDIDGRIHYTNNFKVHLKNKHFILSDYINFNDSQRPYQTDGLDAYIIKCPNNKISDNTDVIKLKTNQEIKFKDFYEYHIV